MRIFNRCAALKCRNNTNNCSLSFFRFPTDINRGRIWLIACSRNDLMQDVAKLHTLSHRLCAIHFEQTMFANKQRNRLLKHAVPRIFPALEGGSSSIAPTSQLRCETSEFLADVSQELQALEPQHSRHVVDIQTLTSPNTRMTQTSASLSANSPRKRKLRTTLKRLRDENYRLKKRLKILQDRKTDSYLDKVTLSDYKQLTNKFCRSKDIADFINKQVGEMVKKPKGRRFTSE
ncbi:unnamed protein product [Psylliodes chrysocephalus]|uniref:THAP-type domain-containing protein n=1 Tax=Psylliodes chrysocephalus TaxID=3402493 RepID=A0A9P0GFC5_9CUCU|nr:unnamed protein product [Psylliodes chrysocephala]